MGIKLSGLREALSALLTDIFHLRTVGGIDKRITGENLSNSLVTDEVLVTSTSSIDLSSYLGNLVIRLGGGSGITFSGCLRAGRMLTLVNSENSTKTLEGTVSGGSIVYLEVRMMVSTGEAFYEFVSSIGGNRKINQNLRTTDQVTFSTVNTGHGNNNVYAMDQDVLTSSSPSFNQIALTSLDINATLSGNSIWTKGEVFTFLNSFLPNIDGIMIQLTGGLGYIVSGEYYPTIFSYAYKWYSVDHWIITIIGMYIGTLPRYFKMNLTSGSTTDAFYGGGMAIGPLMGVRS